jgi:hypothetical protein
MLGTVAAALAVSVALDPAAFFRTPAALPVALGVSLLVADAVSGDLTGAA